MARYRLPFRFAAIHSDPNGCRKFLFSYGICHELLPVGPEDRNVCVGERQSSQGVEGDLDWRRDLRRGTRRRLRH